MLDAELRPRGSFALQIRGASRMSGSMTMRMRMTMRMKMKMTMKMKMKRA